eukprot:scaffold4269_cov19-Tisochrysis_lutea.AAC.1
MYDELHELCSLGGLYILAVDLSINAVTESELLLYTDKSWVMQMVGLNVLLGLSFSGSLAHLAHIGGAVGGAATMWAFGPRFVREWGRVVDKPIIPLPKALQ